MATPGDRDASSTTRLAPILFPRRHKRPWPFHRANKRHPVRPPGSGPAVGRPIAHAAPVRVGCRLSAPTVLPSGIAEDKFLKAFNAPIANRYALSAQPLGF